MQRAGLDFELEGGPGPRGAEISGGMFLTQMGIGGYAALDNFGVTQTDEATALLQKRKKLQEVDAEYTRKRRDFDERMKRCKDREAELAAKQEVIRVNVVRFERFIKDNDTKRQRALKKERDEIAEQLKLQQEVEALELLERQTRMSLMELMDTLTRLAKYEEFLEEVVEASEFSEIPEVLFKFGTMRGTNEDLRRFIETGNGGGGLPGEQ